MKKMLILLALLSFVATSTWASETIKTITRIGNTVIQTKIKEKHHHIVYRYSVNTHAKPRFATHAIEGRYAHNTPVKTHVTTTTVTTKTVSKTQPQHVKVVVHETTHTTVNRVPANVPV